MSPLDWWLLLAMLLFCIGAFGVLARRNTIVVIMSLELMLNAVNIALAIAQFRAGSQGAGVLFSLFVIAACGRRGDGRPSGSSSPTTGRSGRSRTITSTR